MFDDDWNDLNGWNGWNSNLISREWGWQWVFPATGHYIDRVTGENVDIIFMSPFCKERFREARLKVGIAKPATCTRFVTLLRPTCWKMVMISGRFQELLGHSDVATTMVYTHVLNRGGEVYVARRIHWMG